MKFEKIAIEKFFEGRPIARTILSAKAISRIFDNGCFVGGGLMRHLLNCQSIKHFDMYIRGGGDIDVFCPDALSADILKNVVIQREWKRSIGDNAAESYFGFTKADQIMFDEMGHSVPYSFKIQVVDMHFGMPEESISRFDLVNAQIITDGKSVWFNPEIIDLERMGVLKATGINDLLGPRVLKYIKKYGYKSVHPETIHFINEWVKSLDAQFEYERTDSKKKTLHTSLGGQRRLLNAHSVLSNIVFAELLNEKFLESLRGKLSTTVKFYHYDDSMFCKHTFDTVDLVKQRKTRGEVRQGDLVTFVSPIIKGEKKIHTGIIVDEVDCNGTHGILFFDNSVKRVPKDLIANVLSKFEETHDC